MNQKLFFKFVAFAVSGMLLISIISCGVPKKRISFGGKWKKTVENVEGHHEEEISVISDGKRFRIEGQKSIRVYDGTTLYSRVKNLQPNEAVQYPVFDKPITPDQAKTFQFWLGEEVPGKKVGPGGNVAGQETVLYEMKMEPNPDFPLTPGGASVQSWVDVKTGVLLKVVVKEVSLDSSKLLAQDECLEIKYGPIDEKKFVMKLRQ